MADNTNGTQTMSVLNPVGYPPKVTPKRWRRGSTRLDGKTVYLVDLPLRRLGLFLKQMQEWFTDNMPR